MPKRKRESRRVLFRWSHDEHGHAALTAVEQALTAAGVAFDIEYDGDDYATIYQCPTPPRAGEPEVDE